MKRVTRLSPLTMFAAAWVIYKMGCQVEIFCHQTRRMQINLCGPSCCHQAFAAQAKKASGTKSHRAYIAVSEVLRA